MPTLETSREIAKNTDYFVQSITVTDEMFFASDLSVKAAVSKDCYPVGNDHVGEFHTELFRLSDYCKTPLSYKRTSWKYNTGEPIPPYSELSTVLDLELRAFLVNRFNAELYDLLTLDIPRARILSSWRKRLSSWFRRIR